jgi:Dolichyl-phosphate-mannose-protein mannosyltransferase
MTYVASHILSLTLLLVIFHVTGDLVARQTRALDDVGQRTGLMRTSIGIAVWMYLLMALACVGLYRRGVLIGAAVFIGTIGVGLNVAHRFSSAEALAKAVSPETPGGRPFDARPELVEGRAQGRHMGQPLQNWIHILAWLPPAVVLVQLFVRTLGPWLGWDDMSAHLTLPRIWLAHGGFVHLPFNVYSHWPSNVQMLYGLGLAVEDYVLAKLLHLMFLGLLTVAVYRFASRATPWAGLVAASLLLANDVVLVEAPVANIDIGVAFFFFMAVALAVEFRETGTRPALVLSGIFCGCVAGSKITGLGAIACVYPLIALGSTRRQIVRNSALFAACAFALALPWLLKSYVETGDPLYPVLWKHVAGIEWSDTIADQFWRWQNSIGMGRTPRDYALLPIRVILNGGGGYQNFAAWISKTWIVFLPLTLIFTPWVPVARRCLLPAGIYFVIWANSSQQSRFLISVLPLLAVSTAVTTVWAVDLLSRQVRSQKSEIRIRYALAGLVIVGTLAVLGWASRYVRQGSLDATRNLFVDPPNIREWTPDPAFAFVRQQLPPAANVLMLNINHGFFLDRDYIADSFFEASQLNAAVNAAGDGDGLTRLFERLGVTHVFADRTPWVRFPPVLREYLHDPANATVLYTSPDGQFTVYELKRG